MKLSTINYHIEEALKSLIRNSLMAVSSIATIAACVFIIVFSYCVAVNVEYMVTNFENGESISAFIDDSVSPEGVNVLLEKLMEIPHITDVDYISSKTALETLAANQESEEASSLISGLELDTLPRSFIISVDSAKNHDSVLNELKSDEIKQMGIYKIRSPQEIMNLIVSMEKIVRIVSISVIIGLVLLSIVIIMNTIRLAVNNRKSEIKIMKYIGATNMFIRLPFIIEGAIIGIIGSVIPPVAGYLGYNSLVKMAVESSDIIKTVLVFKEGSEIFPFITPYALALGIFIGVFGSAWSIRIHLKA